MHRRLELRLRRQQEFPFAAEIDLEAPDASEETDGKKSPGSQQQQQRRRRNLLLFLLLTLLLLLITLHLLTPPSSRVWIAPAAPTPSLPDTAAGDPPEVPRDGVTDTGTDPVNEHRREAVKEAFRHAWMGYRRYAAGRDELRPVTNSSMDPWGGFGITAVSHHSPASSPESALPSQLHGIPSPRSPLPPSLFVPDGFSGYDAPDGSGG